MLTDVAAWLFERSGLSPHGLCLLWDPGLISLHALSDIGIGCAYFTIPVALYLFAQRRRDLVFRPIFLLFAAFIMLCGTTHFLAVLTLWIPAYGLEGVVKAITAAVSITTAIGVWALMPKAMALPSPQQLQVAHAAVQASEARYRASFERSPVPMQLLDEGGRLIAVSDTWLDMLGYRRDEVVGRKVLEFQPPATELGPLGPTSNLRASGGLRDLDRQYVRRDGTVLDTQISAQVEEAGGRDWTVCVVIDITMRRQAEQALRISEERLHQSQKLEALGQLAGGIAHDLNNTLQAMSGGLELLERFLRQGRFDKATESLGLIRRSLERSAGLTERVLTFARRRPLQPRAIHPGELLQALGELIRSTIGPSIKLELQTDGGSWLTSCDANQLESAVLNLAINARDAMPQGGTLQVRTRERSLGPADLVGIKGVAPGEYVEIDVVDDGVGMSETVRSRVFEPFFTTKPVGKGTGLGLSQVYDLIHRSGGFVQIDSAPGHGTTVRLLLPRDRDAAVAATEAVPARLVDPAQRMSGTVLVVDDEASVRQLVSETLSGMGMKVLEASEGGAARQLLETLPGLDLLITDIGLPELGGQELAAIARQRFAQLPIVLITGYDATAIDSASLPAHAAVLHKPFLLEKLEAEVRTLLVPAVAS